MKRLDIKKPSRFDLLTKLTYLGSKRKLGLVAEPIGLVAHHPRLMLGAGAMQWAYESSTDVPNRIKLLTDLRVSTRIGCPWCWDFGSAASVGAGLTKQHLREIANYKESELFNEQERVALEYADSITNTPVDVTDELFTRLLSQFNEKQIIELTVAISFQNQGTRFNHALGVKSQGFAAATSCALPQPVSSHLGGSNE